MNKHVNADMLAALEAQERVDEHVDNCERCSGGALPEMCAVGFPLADDARLLRRAAIDKATNEGQFCSMCGQVDSGQTGEYPCPECGLPGLHDEPEATLRGVTIRDDYGSALQLTLSPDGEANISIAYVGEIGASSCRWRSLPPKTRAALFALAEAMKEDGGQQ